MNENEQSKNHRTYKSKEELLLVNPEELSPTGRYLQGLLKSYPDLTLTEAIEFMNSLP